MRQLLSRFECIVSLQIVHSFEYHVVYSPSYQVPVLYFNACNTGRAVNSQFLPPAFRRNGEGNFFTRVCLSTPGGRVPPQVRMGGRLLDHADGGGTPIQLLGIPQLDN